MSKQQWKCSKLFAFSMSFLLLGLIRPVWAFEDVKFEVQNPRTNVRLKGSIGLDSEITGIGFISMKLEKKPAGSRPEAPEFYARVTGKYIRESVWALVMGRKLPLNTQREFELLLPMDKERSEFELVAVGPMGLVERARMSIYVPGLYWKPEPVRRVLVGVGTGLTRSDYTETSFPERTQLAITGKLSATTSLSPNWDVGFMTYCTLLPFLANTEVTQHFLGVNVRGGYVIRSLLEPWRLSIQVGWYYLTMFAAPPGTGGFFNVQGPQIYPNIRLQLPKNRSLNGYLKFSPVSDGLNFQDLSNREIAVGGAFMFPDRHGNTWGTTLDISTMRGTFAGAISTLFTVTAGLSYTFCASGCYVPRQQ